MTHLSAHLRLETGEIFSGRAFGHVSDSGISGELVFSTGMVGYVESLTDPSFKSQILVMTYPLIGNYGVPSKNNVDQSGLLQHFESDRIHLSGLIVGDESRDWSHWNSIESLHSWLKREKVPGITGIDTRLLTKLIRERGVVKAQIVYDPTTTPDFNFISKNLVQLVSTTQIISIKSPTFDLEKGGVRILVIDCGLKYNQIRCLLKYNVSVKIVPWNYPFLNDNSFDRIFISNGPGDPTDCGELINNLRQFIQQEKTSGNSPRPIFGICLGHQILALAIGATTYKMKYGNRGLNIPCQLIGTKRAFVTSQNHGYAVDVKSLPSEWSELFVNANDGSNEGIWCREAPFFSVQFHPEARPGPEDSEFLFQLFVENRMHDIWTIMRDNVNETPKRKKVLILGSGGLSIGQSGEFDYSGSQAIKAYKEAGMTTVLINPNIATNQTSPGFADKVYFLPLTKEYILKVIKVERPDCITFSFGGQTALNCGIELYREDILAKYECEVLGTPLNQVIDTEDRDRFKQRLAEVNERAIESSISMNMGDAIVAAEKIGYPVLIRAAYALGGLGSGFAHNRSELENLLKLAFSHSDQVIIDKSLWGWKELEYEVVRDQYDNCICICNMENIDPLGIHTGESIVVAPSQTLDDRDFQMLRTCAIKVIRSLGIIGECNIQFALDPASRQYYIIEVNARLSRSSALASKATGYPLAYVAAKLSLGASLLDIKNSITRETCALFEPSMDYCVVKVPRWDLRKFPQVSPKLDSSMKSIGEAMGISRSFEEAFQKALRMSNDDGHGFEPGLMDADDQELSEPTYRRMWSLATALDLFIQNKGSGNEGGAGRVNGAGGVSAGGNSGLKTYDLERIYQLTYIDKWFLQKMARMIGTYRMIEKFKNKPELDPRILNFAKRLGFSDRQIGRASGSTELAIRNQRKSLNIRPVVKQIDTVAAEFPCYTNYLYTTYSAVSGGIDEDNISHDDIKFNKGSTIVLGSGVYRIGSSVEFDWCCVNAVRELRQLGYHTTMINCNPETVSTDYDEADQLYFDELSFETVMEIYEVEKNCNGIILAMGGQVANNMAMQLFRQGVKVIGTSPEVIDVAENRYKFSRLLDQIGVRQPEWLEATSTAEAATWCKEVEYPVLIRPSYVLSGAAMNVCYSEEDLEYYLKCATLISPSHPVVISKYIMDAKEIEVDAVASGGQIKVMAISEHVENAGVHSGDSTMILPAVDVNDKTRHRIERIVQKLVNAMEICGPFNMQFLVKDDQVKVIECNLRVSRTFPFVSKTLDVNLIAVAIDVMLNRNQLVVENPANKNHAVGVKVAKFSFSRLKRADFSLGVEMVSTGEVACYGVDRYDAYLKALQAADFKLPSAGGGIVISLGTYRFKEDFTTSARMLKEMGYHLYGTRGTSDFFSSMGIQVDELLFAGSGGLSSSDPRTFEYLVSNNKIDLVINASRKGRVDKDPSDKDSQGYLIRRTAVDNSISIIADIKCAKLFVKSLELFHNNGNNLWINTTIDCLTNYKTIKLPGMVDVHIHMREPGDEHKEDWSSGTAAALAGGIVAICAMPNTNPSIIGENELALVEKLASQKAYCDYGIYVGANYNNYQDLYKLADRAIALKMYLNNTFGTLKLDSTLSWSEHIKNWDTESRPLCVHAESTTLGAMLHIANMHNKRIHVCHVARREEIELIKMSKNAGMKITCEVTPHHLFLSEDNLVKLGCCGSVKPNLVTLDDQNALWENMDLIDCFATDHAPHLVREKMGKESPPGFPGLETALPLLLTAVNQGRLTIDQIVEKYHTNPIKIFHLEGLIDNDHTYIEVDINRQWVIPEVPKFSKAGWTPFAGMEVTGMVRRVVIRDKIVYVDGEVLAKPGFGENLGLKSQGRERNILKRSGNMLKRSEYSLPAVSEVSDIELTEFDLNGTVSSSSFDQTKEMGGNNLKSKSIYTVEDLTRENLRLIYNHTDQLRVMSPRELQTRLAGKMVGMIFYEPSTRTNCSFTAAIQRLGGKIVESDINNNSVKKGESFLDFVKCIQSYTDAIVIRCGNDIDLMGLADQNSIKVPIINAGHGSDEHPTQALLDIYTIRQERGTVNGLKIAFMGDLKYGRTVHSLAKLLSLYRVELYYVSPEGLDIPEDVLAWVSSKNIKQSVHRNLDEIISEIDILYVTRIQKERMASDEYQKLVDEGISKYHVTPKSLTNAKDNLVIMHPLPRVDEISAEIDNDPRATYFRQMENGMWVRMGLLDLILH
jgi:carbamoyl-phosphate synthase/aspartate carbamoyltransferase/dihydroorotase